MELPYKMKIRPKILMRIPMKRYPYIVVYVADKIGSKLLKIFLISIKIPANIENKRTKSFLKFR